MSLFTFTTRTQFSALAGVTLILLCGVVGRAETPLQEVSKILPINLGSFHQNSPIQLTDWRALDRVSKSTSARPINNIEIYHAETEYLAPNGEKLQLSFGRFENSPGAYSYFTYLRKNRGAADDSTKPGAGVGTASALVNGLGIIFYKGSNVVMIASSGKDISQATALAQLVAPSLEDGEGEVPVLAKHLPNFESVEPTVIYAVSAGGLELAANQPILKEISFDGGTEAVVANYNQSQLVIVEFTTPQFSIDNDQRIWAKISELKSQGQPTPTAYRRVGNYSVFVFNAPDEKTASALIDQVKYEQVVQWLGDDPHLYQRLQKYFAETSAGVLVAVLKSSGLSLLFCLAAGGLIGTMLFRRRRAQRAAAYSDAGGSIRLNLDDLTGPVTSQNLLPGAKQSEPHSTNL